MTIASEIQRLQTAKSCLKTAIESKGVSVGNNVTLEQYYNCVNAIQQGITGLCFADVLIVGAGGAGGGASSNTCSGGGGGGGEVICREYLKLSCNSYNICVGMANGGSSCIGSLLIARGGCSSGYNSGTGGTSGSGQNGGTRTGTGYAAGGGGGAFSAGCNSWCSDGGNGGAGLYGYGGGGGGGGSGTCGRGIDGGASVGGGPTNCGGGGAGAAGYRADATSGAPGVVIICYKPDGSYGFTNATGGTKTSCNGYCIHTFTSNGTFTIVS